jgi:hypothetical protein
MSGFPSAPAPVGTTPAAGGFGGAGFGAAAPASGFGVKTGGFGAAGGTGFGASAAPATFGAKTAGFGGTAGAGGFGGGATTGGFGQAPAAGFGAKGFGGGSGLGTTGFGQPAAAGAANMNVNPYANPAGSAGSAVVGQYLLQWDNVYNADHPDCKFRDFVYNMCTPGHSEMAILRERRAPQSRGAVGCKEEQWLIARRDNPDPERMYPSPVHFMIGLKARATKQKEAVADYHARVDWLLDKLAELRSLQAENDDRYRKLLQEQSMVEGRVLMAMAKAEVLRQGGLKVGEERHRIAQRTEQLRGILEAMSQSLSDLESLALESTTDAQNGVGDCASVIASSTQPATVKEWGRLIEANELGIAKVQRVVKEDSRILSTILQRIDSAP